MLLSPFSICHLASSLPLLALWFSRNVWMPSPYVLIIESPANSVYWWIVQISRHGIAVVCRSHRVIGLSLVQYPTFPLSTGITPVSSSILIQSEDWSPNRPRGKHLTHSSTGYPVHLCVFSISPFAIRWFRFVVSCWGSRHCMMWSRRWSGHPENSFISLKYLLNWMSSRSRFGCCFSRWAFANFGMYFLCLLSYHQCFAFCAGAATSNFCNHLSVLGSDRRPRFLCLWFSSFSLRFLKFWSMALYLNFLWSWWNYHLHLIILLQLYSEILHSWHLPSAPWSDSLWNQILISFPPSLLILLFDQPHISIRFLRSQFAQVLVL